MTKRTKPKKKIGRPSEYTPAIAAEICERVALGQTIRQICSARNMPKERTIYGWLIAHDDFQQKYAHARAESGHVAADGVAEVAEEVRKGKLEPDRGRVVIDALKWSAGKRKPKVYGDKIVQEHSGRDGGPIAVVDLTGLNDEELAQYERLCQKLSRPASGSAGGEGGDNTPQD